MKKIIPLTKKKRKCIISLKKCHICKIGFSTDDNNKKYHKVKGHCRYT